MKPEIGTIVRIFPKHLAEDLRPFIISNELGIIINTHGEFTRYGPKGVLPNREELQKKLLELRGRIYLIPRDEDSEVVPSFQPFRPFRR